MNDWAIVLIILVVAKMVVVSIKLLVTNSNARRDQQCKRKLK